MKESKHKKLNGQKNTPLIVLAAVSALVALLLFLDAFLPIFPTGAELPWHDGSHTDEEETDDAREPAGEIEYFTEYELINRWYDPLLKRLTEMERGGDYWNTNDGYEVGLFDFDLNGIPEIIVRTPTEGGYDVYYAYAVDTGVMLASWEGGASEKKRLQQRLAVYAEGNNADTCEVILTHEGNGNGEYLFRLFLTNQFYCDELYAMERTGLKKEYRVDGYSVSRREYKQALRQYTDACTELTDTALILFLGGNSTPEEMADRLLSSGQKIIKPQK